MEEDEEKRRRNEEEMKCLGGKTYASDALVGGTHEKLPFTILKLFRVHAMGEMKGKHETVILEQGPRHRAEHEGLESVLQELDAELRGRRLCLEREGFDEERRKHPEREAIPRAVHTSKHIGECIHHYMNANVPQNRKSGRHIAFRHMRTIAVANPELEMIHSTKKLFCNVHKHTEAVFRRRQGHMSSHHDKKQDKTQTHIIISL